MAVFNKSGKRTGERFQKDHALTTPLNLDKFYACLTLVAEASAMGWKVWNPQESSYQDGIGQTPTSAPLFIPMNLTRTHTSSISSMESDWALLVVQADRRWTMVYSSTRSTISQSHLQIMVKELLTHLSTPPRKIIFQTPIYQEEGDIQGNDSVVLLIAACYRAANHDVPLVFEILEAWRVVMELLADECVGEEKDSDGLTIVDVMRSDVQTKVMVLSRLAEDISKTTKLEKDLSTLLANSDLPTRMHFTKCAQVFAKLASECTGTSGKVRIRMNHISGILNNAQKVNEPHVASDHERLSPAMNDLLKALEGEGGK